MKVDVTVGTGIVATTRMRQMSAMFDAPLAEKMTRTWTAELPLEERAWQIGAIIGPSGCGKTTIARHLFGEPIVPAWGPESVVDSFGEMSIDRIAHALSSVGFNTIPAWMRPYGTLSNGERFRCDLARILVDERELVWIDEFTSVVDRQVACIGSNAVARFVRKEPSRHVVVASCHHDIVDWLQPDWTLEPATMTFTWRSVQPRPRIDAVIKRAPRALWPVFAPYHYLTASLNKAAQCFALFVADRPVAFIGVLPMPVSNGPERGTAIMRVSRVVTLPDWQGLGLAFVLMEAIGAAYLALGKRFRNYPAHPPFIHAHRRSARWRETDDSTQFKTKPKTDAIHGNARPSVLGANIGERACGRFEYVGDAMLDARAARNLIARG